MSCVSQWKHLHLVELVLCRWPTSLHASMLLCKSMRCKALKGRCSHSALLKVWWSHKTRGFRDPIPSPPRASQNLFLVLTSSDTSFWRWVPKGSSYLLSVCPSIVQEMSGYTQPKKGDSSFRGCLTQTKNEIFSWCCVFVDDIMFSVDGVVLMFVGLVVVMDVVGFVLLFRFGYFCFTYQSVITTSGKHKNNNSSNNNNSKNKKTTITPNIDEKRRIDRQPAEDTGKLLQWWSHFGPVLPFSPLLTIDNLSVIKLWALLCLVSCWCFGRKVLF